MGTACKRRVALVMSPMGAGVDRVALENAWLAVPTKLHRALPYFRAGFRSWIGDCALEWRWRTGQKEAAEFIPWCLVGYHQRRVSARDGLFMTVPTGCSAEYEPTVLFGVP